MFTSDCSSVLPTRHLGDDALDLFFVGLCRIGTIGLERGSGSGHGLHRVGERQHEAVDLDLELSDALLPLLRQLHRGSPDCETDPCVPVGNVDDDQLDRKDGREDAPLPSHDCLPRTRPEEEAQRPVEIGLVSRHGA